MEPIVVCLCHEVLMVAKVAIVVVWYFSPKNNQINKQAPSDATQYRDHHAARILCQQ